MKVKNYPEIRILAILGIIYLGWQLLGLFSSFLSIFADIFIVLILSWVLAFVLEPLVARIARRDENQRLPRVWAAALVYLFLALAAVVVIWVVLPTTVMQISQFTAIAPSYLPENSYLMPKVEAFLNATAANSIFLASGLASAATGTLLVFILSFYFLLSKNEISKFMLDIIPDDYEEDYLFLEKTLNETFASFLRVQVVMGLILGLITLLTLVVLGINFPLSTALLAAILAMVPVVGPIIFLLPVVLAALTVSVQKAIIAVAVIALAAQLVYNFLAPKLLGSALRIHPIVILLSFVIGYRLAGFWGAVFAVPVTSAVVVIIKDLLKYWKVEADKS